MGAGVSVEYRVESGTSWLCVRSVGTLLSSLGRAPSLFCFSRPPPSLLTAGEIGAGRPVTTEGRQLNLRELKARLDRSDRAAALQALELALSELEDGVTLVWERRERALTGRIKPVSVFRDDKGRVCRHVVYSLALGGFQREVEGVACRDSDGSWSLSG